MFDITVILELVLVIITAIVCRYLIPWLKEKHLEWLVTIATQAAEQTITNSDDKKNYVIEWLQARGITYDASKIDAIIESCVYKINNETKDNTVAINNLATEVITEEKTNDSADPAPEIVVGNGAEPINLSTEDN